MISGGIEVLIRVTLKAKFGDDPSYRQIFYWKYVLTSHELHPSCPNPGRRKKIEVFIFTFLCGATKGFMKGLHKTI